MTSHPTHDWSEHSHCCTNCGIHFLDALAHYRCEPTTDDSPKEEPDFLEITRGVVG